MSKPNYRPNRGAALKGDNAAVRIPDDRSGDGDYGTYPQSCGWSAIIMPDDEQGRHREENGADPPEPRVGPEA